MLILNWKVVRRKVVWTRYVQKMRRKRKVILNWKVVRRRKQRQVILNWKVVRRKVVWSQNAQKIRRQRKIILNRNVVWCRNVQKIRRQRKIVWIIIIQLMIYMNHSMFHHHLNLHNLYLVMNRSLLLNLLNLPTKISDCLMIRHYLYHLNLNCHCLDQSHLKNYHHLRLKYHMNLHLKNPV